MKHPFLLRRFFRPVFFGAPIRQIFAPMAKLSEFPYFQKCDKVANKKTGGTVLVRVPVRFPGSQGFR